MRIIILISFLFLSACAQVKTQMLTENSSPDKITAKDNYRFLQKEYENLTPGVQFILMKSEEESIKIKKDVFGRDWKKIAGFTYWNGEKGTCRIYIPDPAWKYTPELIGHEVAHCIWGRFHKGKLGQGAIINQPIWSREMK